MLGTSCGSSTVFSIVRATNDRTVSVPATITGLRSTAALKVLAFGVVGSNSGKSIPIDNRRASFRDFRPLPFAGLMLSSKSSGKNALGVVWKSTTTERLRLSGALCGRMVLVGLFEEEAYPSSLR